MRDPAPEASQDQALSLERSDSSRPPMPAPSVPREPLEPSELARWLSERTGSIVERWLDQMRSREPGWREAHVDLLGRFLRAMASMIPPMLGPYRHQAEPFWLQLSELYGSVAAQRGLAAGEVIEEVQYLRDAVIRLLYTDPPLQGGRRLALRDILRLNRILDQGVTHASVGHTDALFFFLFQGSGVPEALEARVVQEIEDQLHGIEVEVARLEPPLGH